MKKKQFNSLASRIIITITGVLMTSLIITTSFFSNRAKQKLSESIEGNALNLLEATKNHVESQYNSILYHKTYILSRRKIELKNNVEVLMTMADRAYKLYETGHLNSDEAKQRAITAIQQARYDNDVGYSWINDIDSIPRMVMHPFLPELTGHPMDSSIYNYGSGEEKNIGQAFINVCLEKGEGYVDYQWPKPIPGGQTELQPKISYVKLFKPWNWIIGNGFYYDDIEADVQNRINAVINDLNKTIKKQRIGESGYFFIFSEENLVLVHPNLAGASVNDIINPSTGNLLYPELKKAAFSADHYMEYNWDKPGFEGDYQFPKKTFVTYYKPLGWYIASSVYKEDFEKGITNLTNTILLFSVFLLLIAFIISFLVSRSITKPLNVLINTISITDKDGLPIKPISPVKIAEIKVLSTTINTMIDSIRKSRKELQDERDYSMELINTTPHIICGLSPTGITTFINPAGENITGYSKEEIIGKNWWTLLYPDKEYELIKRKFLNFPEEKVTELTLIRKNGEKREIVWNSFTKRDNQNNILEIIGFGNDITTQNQIEKELIKAKDKAEESDRLKSAFLANLSHEIRTPMNGILGFAQLLKEPELTGQTQQQYISIIEKSGDRMLNIINDIVTISKIESEQVEVNIQESNVNEQIEYIYNFFKPEIEQKGLQISFQCPLPWSEAIINTDIKKIHTILTNLVKNAIKFTEKGSIELGYIIKKETETTVLEFYVQDTGIGIPQERQEAIFDRFTKSDISDKMALQGAGLGLSISKALVEILGGKLRMESKQEHGSTFYFTTPYNPKPTTKNDHHNLISTINNEIRINSLKALIVEDDKTSDLLASTILKKICYEILHAKTGIEAIKICKNNPDLNLILMDIKIPDINGYEATRQIRQFNKNIIILAQTAFAQTYDRKKAIESGCNDYISKPLNKKKLIELITKYLAPEK